MGLTLVVDQTPLLVLTLKLGFHTIFVILIMNPVFKKWVPDFETHLF